MACAIEDAWKRRTQAFVMSTDQLGSNTINSTLRCDDSDVTMTTIVFYIVWTMNLCTNFTSCVQCNLLSCSCQYRTIAFQQFYVVVDCVVRVRVLTSLCVVWFGVIDLIGRCTRFLIYDRIGFRECFEKSVFALIEFSRLNLFLR